MSISFELKDLETLLSNAKQIQEDVLMEILTLNANTEYLQRFLHGNSDRESFKKNVPLVSYDDVKPYIDRVANGEPSDVITGGPITRFLRSSGTSGGKQKIFPMNDMYNEKLGYLFALASLITSKHFNNNNIDAEKGKKMMFLYNRSESTTPSGLLVSLASTSYLKSHYFTNRPSTCHPGYTSPDQVIMCADNKQSVYCHLLCGLSQRDEVVGVGATFAYALVQAINALQIHWKELSSNIRSGHLSEWITDPNCINSVSAILGGPNPKLADVIEQECSKQSWEGIITRLWPKAKYFECIITGQMAQYIPTLEFYSNKLHIVSPIYGSSESLFGINVDPLSKPQDVSYTFVPNLSYFEFLPVDHKGDMTSIVDLVDVKLGCYYEPVITNYFGLHRYLIGDILQVTGFYNSTPQFRFVRRKNMVLSVEVEATTEEDILKALARATLVLHESTNYMLTGFTCYADISTFPGHYVFYWELKAKDVNDVVELDEKVFTECCYALEESFDALYRRLRSHDGLIGPLEIKVVQQGTFDSLMEYFISQGGSIGQYKAPMCIKSSEALAVLEDKDVQMAQYIPILEFYSNKLPIVSTTYGSSESTFGMNVDPLCKPQDVSYVCAPNITYFEFLPVDHKGDMACIVDLVDVKLGCYYEPVVTNYFGLHRYLIGDILQVTGFYNNTPQFRFVHRKNVVLSVRSETTTEEDILKALNHAGLVIESSDLMLMGFTCYADISTFPGHYVFYWELKVKEGNYVVEFDKNVLVECCSVLEESFDEVYRKNRTKDECIGPLEIRVVQQGTFDSLMEYFVSQGGSIAQYMTPICINSSEPLAVLENKVLAQFFSKKSPPHD